METPEATFGKESQSGAGRSRFPGPGSGGGSSAVQSGPRAPSAGSSRERASALKSRPTVLRMRRAQRRGELKPKEALAARSC